MAGVPSAALQRRDREAAELTARGIDPNSGAPVAVQVESPQAITPTPSPAPATPAPTVQPIPAEPAPDAGRIRQLEEALSTANGRASAAAAEAENTKRQLEVVNQNRTFLENKLTEQQEQLDAQKAQIAELADKQGSEGVSKVLESLKDADISPAMKEKFDPDTEDYVRRISKSLLSQVLNPVVERLAVLEKALGRVKVLEEEVAPAAERSGSHDSACDAGSGDGVFADGSSSVLSRFRDGEEDFRLASLPREGYGEGLHHRAFA
jgi:hypothetical protein